MDPLVQHPAVTRGRILFLALLAAFVWLLLSVFGGGTSAAADDSPESDDTLLGGIVATVDKVVPVSAIAEPVTKVTEPLVEPLIEPVKPVLKPVAENFVKPLLDQPVVDKTVKLVNDVVDTLSEPLTDEAPQTIPAAPPVVVDAAAANKPEPVATPSVVAPDTRVTHVDAAGSITVPQMRGDLMRAAQQRAAEAPVSPEPVAPAAPATAPGSAQSQGSGAPSMVAAVSSVGVPVAVAGASAAWEHLALPPSPTFDSDSSPD